MWVPISRVFCEKWGFSLMERRTPRPTENQTSSAYHPIDVIPNSRRKRRVRNLLFYIPVLSRITKNFPSPVVSSRLSLVYTHVTVQSASLEAVALPVGGRLISELEDIDSLVRLYKPKVFRFVALSIADRDAAESITHDCFLKAHATRERFRGECSIATWLLRIAFNLVRDHTKSQKFKFWRNAAASAVDPAEISQHLPSQIGSPEAQLLARERVEIVARALENLSARQRSVFLMRFVEDMDLPDIASATGMPVPTVKTHLYRAIAAIRARFGDLP
jgi:RNA polymerase sigma-70 factor, ECF subfamily